MPTVTDSSTLSSGDFRVGERCSRPTVDRLERDGDTLQLDRKWMEILVDLAGHAGHLEREDRGR